MFLDFFLLLRAQGIPVTLPEHLALLEALQKGHGSLSVEAFYYLARTLLVKHERHLDRFDAAFAHYFEGAAALPPEQFRDIPEDWLRKHFENQLTEEEKRQIEAFGGLDKLMERFRELMKEQQERHEGGSKWIGTGGVSPFGAYGYNPAGFRIGQDGSRHRRAVKVWDKRDFRNFSDEVELNTRNLKMALRRLRVFSREGRPTELDLDATIRKTSENAGLLELEMVPERKNHVRILLLLDVGGSMDDHVRTVEELFSAAKHEFRHLDYYYFHNCVYEGLWKDNSRRNERIPTMELLNTFNPEHRVIIVGDASMSPFEIVSPGGSVEHFNDEPGIVWLERLRSHFPHIAWLNPIPKAYWTYTRSILMLEEFMDGRMYELTPAGIAEAVETLKKKGN